MLLPNQDAPCLNTPLELCSPELCPARLSRLPPLTSPGNTLPSIPHITRSR